MPRPFEINVELDRGEQVFINGESFPLASVNWGTVLKRAKDVAIAQTAPILVTLTVDASVSYEAMIQVLNGLSAMSIRDVTLAFSDADF